MSASSSPFAIPSATNVIRLHDREKGLRRPRLEGGVPVFSSMKDAPVDWSSPPEGFVAYPSLYPQCFMALEEAIPHEAHRLFKLASAEFDRLRPHRQHDPKLLADLRTGLRLEELLATTYGQAVMDAQRAPPVEGEVSAQENAVGFVHEDGTVSYRDASGKFWRQTVAHWIGFTIARLASVSMQERSRQFNAGCEGLDEDACQELDDRLRRELHTDELRAVAFGAKQRPDPIFAAIEEHRAAHRFANEGEVVGRDRTDEELDADVDVEVNAFGALRRTVQTSPAGLAALAAYLPEYLANVGSEYKLPSFERGLTFTEGALVLFLEAGRAFASRAMIAAPHSDPSSALNRPGFPGGF